MKIIIYIRIKSEQMEKPPTFIIKRLKPEEAAPLQLLWQRSKRKTSQRSYSTTTDDLRYVLLNKVLAKELTVSEAAAKYGLKYTTAKNIIDLFLREGRIEKKKHRIKYGSGIKKVKQDDKKEEITIVAGSPLPTSSGENSAKMVVSRESMLSTGFWANRITEHLG